MKESRYNKNICLKNGKRYLYNLRTQALILVDDDFVQRIDNLNNEYRSLLIENEFLLQDDLDELKILKRDYYSTIINSKEIHISVMTTLNCNFRCTYCFERKTDSFAKADLILQIEKLIYEYIDNIKIVTIDWYGGEPLMNYRFIESSSLKIKEFCKKNNLLYNASITTNGYLLTEKIAKNLSELNVTSAQISIDGPQETHDQRRFLLNGAGTFDMIVENCLNAQKYIHIDIRVNIDKVNYKSVFSLLEMFSNQPTENISFIFNGVVSSNENPLKNGEELSGEELSDCIYNLNKYAFDNGLDIGILKIFDATKNYFCVVDSLSQFIITPDGRVFKCGESYTSDDKGCIGNIYNSPQIDEVKLSEWFKDPFVDDKCKSCKILPMCYGGCQMKKRNKLTCCPDDIKYHIDDYIRLYISMLED